MKQLFGNSGLVSTSINPLESGIETKIPVYWQRKVFCEIAA